MKKRLKVLSVVDGLGFGGAETRLLTMGQLLDRTKFEHSVLTLNPLFYTGVDEFLARRDQYIRAAIQVDDLSETIPDRSGEFNGLRTALRVKTGIYRRARRLASVILARDIDVIDSHLSSAGLVSALAGRLTKTPCSLTIYCGKRVGDATVWPWTTRLALRLATSVLTDSEVRAYELRAILPRRAAAKVAVVANGIERPQSIVTSKAMRLELSLPKGSHVRVVGQVARLIEYKGQLVFLHAARKILEKEPNTGFLLSGSTSSDAYKSRLQRLAENLGIADRIAMTECRGNIGDIWNVIDVHAHPSLFDSLPIAIAEGMSLAKPVVATSVGGIPEMILDGKTGFLVPPADAEMLADKILRLLRQPELAEQLGNRAKQRYEELYRPERMVWAMEEYFMGMHEQSRTA